MTNGAHLALLRVYGRLPRRLRLLLVHFGTPSFTVGAVCAIHRDDGALLLVRHSYRRRWGLPGGLLRRGEEPAEAVRREVMEEVGLDVELLGQPAVVVDADARRVDLIFAARVGGNRSQREAEARSVEIVAAEWFLPGLLPELQPEASGALASLAKTVRR